MNEQLAKDFYKEAYGDRFRDDLFKLRDNKENQDNDYYDESESTDVDTDCDTQEEIKQKYNELEKIKELLNYSEQINKKYENNQIYEASGQSLEDYKDDYKEYYAEDLGCHDDDNYVNNLIKGKQKKLLLKEYKKGDIMNMIDIINENIIYGPIRLFSNSELAKDYPEIFDHMFKNIEERNNYIMDKIEYHGKHSNHPSEYMKDAHEKYLMIYLNILHENTLLD
jgi:hypothetical protein